jgi:hypothetical protein
MFFPISKNVMKDIMVSRSEQDVFHQYSDASRMGNVIVMSQHDRLSIKNIVDYRLSNSDVNIMDCERNFPRGPILVREGNL